MRPAPLFALLAMLTCSLATPAAAAESVPVVGEHQTFTQRRTIRNPHDRAIRIGEIESSCTCNRIELGERFLLPLAETTLDFETDNDNNSGRRHHKVWLFPTHAKLTPIIEIIEWDVQPNIAVDLVQRGALDQRPEQLVYRDVYSYTSWLKPDEIAQRLSPSGADSKRVRLWSPPASRPGVDALHIEGIDYDGDIFAFKHKALDNDSILLLIHAAETAPTVPPGNYTQTVTVRTNHPHKPSFELTLNIAIDPKAHEPGSQDPWAYLR